MSDVRGISTGSISSLHSCPDSRKYLVETGGVALYASLIFDRNSCQSGFAVVCTHAQCNYLYAQRLHLTENGRVLLSFFMIWNIWISLTSTGTKLCPRSLSKNIRGSIVENNLGVEHLSNLCSLLSF